MQYTADNILVRPGSLATDPDLILSITPEESGWEYISFQARRLAADQCWSFESGENELVIVNLSGRYSVRSNRGQWSGIGARKNVFEGAAHALYLPRRSEFTITAEGSGEYAVAWVPTDQDHEPWLIRPEGYAYQRVYTDENSPLHRAGYPIDALVRAENNCAVLVPKGYHPVVSAPGYTTYYLNVLAGSAQTLANQDDPKYTWVKDTYRQRDARLPLY